MAKTAKYTIKTITLLGMLSLSGYLTASEVAVTNSFFHYPADIKVFNVVLTMGDQVIALTKTPDLTTYSPAPFGSSVSGDIIRASGSSEEKKLAKMASITSKLFHVLEKINLSSNDPENPLKRSMSSIVDNFLSRNNPYSHGFTEAESHGTIASSESSSSVVHTSNATEGTLTLPTLDPASSDTEFKNNIDIPSDFDFNSLGETYKEVFKNNSKQ